MKSILIIAVLCLSLILISGITPASRNTGVPAGGAGNARGPPYTPTPTASHKGVSGGQARWLRVVLGLCR